MKIAIGDGTHSADTVYTNVKNIKFDPSADVTGSSLEVNQFSASIQTTDTIGFGKFATLYDNKGNVWATYWITDVEEESDAYVNITAQSLIVLLDRVTMPAKMYAGETAPTVFADIFSNISNISSSAVYKLDDSFSAKTVTGYSPEQSARERLQEVCMVLGAYVKAFFNEVIEILPVSTTRKQIPLAKTFYRPTVSYSDFVTGVSVTAYSYEQRTPGENEESVVVGETTYVQTMRVYSANNSSAYVPATAAVNVVEVSDCTLINESNATEVLNRLAGYYFKRQEVQVECIDTLEDGLNQLFLPADLLAVQMSADFSKNRKFITSYASSCSFSFGKLQKARITIKPIDEASIEDGVILTINYVGVDKDSNQLTLYTEQTLLLKNTGYDIDTKYIPESGSAPKEINGSTYVYYPTDEKISVNLAEDKTVTENENIALRSTPYKTNKNVLYIDFVDGAESSTIEEDGEEMTEVTIS